MSRLSELKRHLRRGNVYRRSELEQWSNSVDRHIGELMEEGTLEKVGPSLYYYPKKNAFGIEPPSKKALVRKFLKEGKFLITSYNHFNKLGVGTTQLYNNLIVYNHTRSGNVKLANTMFTFRKKGDFPTVSSKEYLLVDLVNNLGELAEGQEAVLKLVQQSLPQLNSKVLNTTLQRYGTARTRKLLTPATV